MTLAELEAELRKRHSGIRIRCKDQTYTVELVNDGAATGRGNANDLTEAVERALRAWDRLEGVQ